MTPLEIDILIHYYACADDFRDLDAPAIREAIDKFVGEGILLIIKDDPDNYPSNQRYMGNQDALEPYIKKICSNIT